MSEERSAGSSGRAPDWAHWRMIGTVEVWEAVALSMNIEPRKMNLSSTGFGFRHNAGPEFDKRLSLAQRCLGGSLPCESSVAGEYLGDSKLVRLPVFARWGTDAGWDMPRELSELASSVAAGPDSGDYFVREGRREREAGGAEPEVPATDRVVYAEAVISAGETLFQDNWIGSRTPHETAVLRIGAAHKDFGAVEARDTEREVQIAYATDWLWKTGAVVQPGKRGWRYVRRAELEAALDDERRRRLDSGAGISRVPAPLRPLRGGVAPAYPREPENRRPIWDVWRHVPQVEVWQAVALSLNIEPQAAKRTTANGFVEFDEGQEFSNRLLVALANPGALAPGRKYAQLEPSYRVELTRFVEWAAGLSWDLPAELLEFGTKSRRNGLANAQRKCAEWLSSLAKSGALFAPNETTEKPNPKQHWEGKALTTIRGLSKRAFSRAWADVALDYSQMSKSGRKAKSSQ